MVARIWRTQFDPERLEELQRFARDVSAPMFRELPGCLGYLYGVSGSTWITQTFWASHDHIAAAEESALYRDVVDRILAAGFLRPPQETELFDISDYAPALI